MKLIERIKNKFSEGYFISVYENNIYVLNYQKIIKFNSEEILIKFDNKKVHIKGNNFTMFRKNEFEFELSGIINKMEFINE